MACNFAPQWDISIEVSRQILAIPSGTDVARANQVSDPIVTPTELLTPGANETNALCVGTTVSRHGLTLALVTTTHTRD